jgi:hypothetical protein
MPAGRSRLTSKRTFGSDSSRRKKYRLFISHSWENSGDYERMVDLLSDYNYFGWTNYSVPEEKEIDASTNEELREELNDQIRPASVFIALGGEYVENSNWIRTETIMAKVRDKSILGVRPWGQTEVPDFIEDNSDDVVGWQASSIVSAIRDLAP